jgi:hypothetical protein
MAGISHQKLCEVSRGFGVAGEFRTDIPENTNIKEAANNELSKGKGLVVLYRNRT